MLDDPALQGVAGDAKHLCRFNDRAPDLEGADAKQTLRGFEVVGVEDDRGGVVMGEETSGGRRPIPVIRVRPLAPANTGLWRCLAEQISS